MRMIRVTIQINKDSPLLDIIATREHPLEKPKVGEVCVYRIEEVIYGVLVYQGELEFPFGDANKLTMEIIKKYGGK